MFDFEIRKKINITIEISIIYIELRKELKL